ncbi:metalloprotease [Mycena crocata]|nr:metalloprotease [Mycena crocata]
MAPFASLARTLALLSIAFQASNAQEALTECANVPSQEVVEAAEAHFRANKVMPASNSFSAADAQVTLNVYFHVIYETETFEGGYLPQEQVEQAIDVMNDYYAPTPYAWTLADTIRTQSQDWFDNVNFNNSQEAAMKQALHRGGPADLNVYTANFTNSQGFIGWSTFPWDVPTAPLGDGVVMYYDTLPGGSNPNKGNTLVHETGHWLGLYHPFQSGSCEEPNDFVEDTPAQRRPVYECNLTSDTCPDKPGLDAIENLMGYARSCRRTLTPGQLQRTREQMATYRNVFV